MLEPLDLVVFILMTGACLLNCGEHLIWLTCFVFIQLLNICQNFIFVR